ncbi:group 1 glycosyl transferase [Natronorubrum bangense JCM 10635]|uniref:Group 1 glycosyl transferase n=2 Tax=Natronorubrum bangense TaxID=61858 RepID=L9VZJ0_9EURY|nr:group 1 glycosyl transferase [Natronorubrum bangense JCM 10635]
MKERVGEASLTDGLRVEKIPNGIDTTIFQPGDRATGRRIFDLPEDKQIILFGAINPDDERKGYTYLKAALEELEDRYDSSEVEIAIFGQLSSDFDLPFEVNSVGYLYDDEALSLLYSTADVMIVPSVEDVFPNTALEATACGTPVVAFDSTGTADIVAHKETGYLAEFKNSSDLCEGIEWTLQSRKHNRTISSHARTRALERYEIKEVANRYRRLYENLS